MSSYFAGQMAGGFVTAVVLTALLWFAARRWPPSCGKAFYVTLVAFALGVMLRAIGNADDGPPDVLESVAHMVIPQAVLLIALLMLARHHHRKSLPYPELADPRVVLELNRSPTATLDRRG